MILERFENIAHPQGIKMFGKLIKYPTVFFRIGDQHYSICFGTSIMMTKRQTMDNFSILCDYFADTGKISPIAKPIN